MGSKVSGIIEQIQLGSNGNPQAIASTAYGYCETPASTAGKTVDMTGFQLIEGVTVHIRFAETNSASNPTLNINETGAWPMVQYGTSAMSTAAATTGWYAGAVVSFTFVVVDSTHKYWVRDQAFNTNSTYTITSVWCNTGASTAAKVSSNSTYYTLRTGNIFELTLRYGNTYAGPLTLNVNSTGAKPIFIDEIVSSAENYTLPAGKYIVFYDGTNYHFRTDGKIPSQAIPYLNWKTLQSNITSPSTDTTESAPDAFIDTISQNTNGEITATKKYVPVKNVFIPETTSTDKSIITDRQAFIPYATTSTYGLVKVNELNSSTTIPLYIDTSGILKKCSTYAGGTKITLNGADKGANTASIYAPTLSGNSGELLISSGTNTAPTWTGNGIFSSNTWIFSQKLKINPENNDSHSQNLYVHGTAYIDDTTQIGDIIIGSGTSQNTITTISAARTDLILSPTGKLQLYQTGTDTGATPTARVILDQNTFYPYANNQVSLGIDSHYWKELYATTIITTPAGSSTKPIYIGSNGEIAESNATVGSQYQPVYLNSGTITAAYPVQYLSWTFANANDNQIVFSNSLFTASTYVLSIVVTSGESNLNGPITWVSGAGTLTLSTSPVTGVVSGYILISFGADLSSTISGTSSHSNT